MKQNLSIQNLRPRLARLGVVLGVGACAAAAAAAPAGSSPQVSPTVALTPKAAISPNPALQRALTAPLAFSSVVEVQKAAQLKLAAAKKTAKPASAEPTTLTISLQSQSAGTQLELFRAEYVGFSPVLRASFKSTVETVFRPERPRVEVTFPVEPANVYVMDCPTSGVGGGHHRLEFAATGSRYSTVEMRGQSTRTGRFLISYLADRPGNARLALQGHLLDGEDYTWGFNGCRVTVVPYM